MKFRAVAVASQRSNAVGTVEVECTPSGLVIVYLGVGAFSQGYATAAVTSGTRVMAPWSAVLEARAEGEQIFLGLDHAVSPHNRLTLVNFSTGEGTHHLEARRQRAMVRVAFVALALIAALAAMFTLPRLSARVGAATALGVGAVAAFSILTIGFIADRRIPFGGFYTETARLGFVSELGSYLPNLIRAPLPPKPGRAPWLPAFQGFLPRTTLAIVITLSASILGAVLVAHSILENKPEPGSPERETSRSDKGRGETESRDFAAQPAPMPLVPAPPAPLATSVSPALTESAPASSAPPKAQPPRTEPVLARLLGPCTCARAQSLLWKEPIERLSILVMSTRARQKGRRKLLEADIAAINNGDRDIRDLSLDVEFYEQDPAPSERRHWASHRVLFFQGPLVPGQAVKWTTEAEGTDLEFKNPIPDRIGPAGDGAAPASRFVELLDANNRAVRLHAARCLVYLGDPRARDAVLKLRDALREEESPYLGRLLDALNDVRVCQLTVTRKGSLQQIGACLSNSSDQTRDKLGLRVRALAQELVQNFPTGPSPIVLDEATVKIPGALAPKTGALISAEVTYAPTAEPAAFEAMADRMDLLP